MYKILRWNFRWVLVSGVLAPPFIGTTIFYRQDYRTAVNDWSPRLYAASLSQMAATTVVFALICGAVIDRFRATSVLPGVLLPLSAACFALGVSGSAWMLVIAMVLLATAAGPGITRTLIDHGIPLATQMTWLGVYCLLAIVAMSLATTRLLARRKDEHENTDAVAR